MPIIKSATKRAKQAEVRRGRNVSLKRQIKAAIKSFLAKPDAKKLSAAQSELDTAVKKGLLKKNTAARRKSSLAKTAKESGVKLEASKKTAKPAAKKAVVAKAAAKKPAVKKATATKKPVAKKPAVKKPAAKKTTK